MSSSLTNQLLQLLVLKAKYCTERKNLSKAIKKLQLAVRYIMQECYQHKQYSLIKKLSIYTSIGVYYLENSYILALTKLLLCILKESKVYKGQTSAVQYDCQHSQVISPMSILHWKGRFCCRNYRALEPQPSFRHDDTRHFLQMRQYRMTTQNRQKRYDSLRIWGFQLMAGLAALYPWFSVADSFP